MPKFKITFCDVIEADDKLNAYNKFRAYLKECVEMEKIFDDKNVHCLGKVGSITI